MACCGLLALAALGELLECERADCLEQPPTAGRYRSIESHQRLRDEIRDTLQHSRCSTVAVARDSRCGFNRELAGEDCQMAQQAPLRLRQQLIAPVERRAQCLMSRQGGSS